MIRKILLFIITFFSLFWWIGGTNINPAFAENNINIWSLSNEWSHVRNNDKLQDFGNDGFLQLSWNGWEKGIYYTLVRVARDLKNLFFILATIFFIIMVFQVLFAWKTEEAVESFKKGIIWITLGIIIMQIAYAFTRVLYDQNVWGDLAFRLVENIINPLVKLIETIASFFFIGIAFYSFFRLVTSNGDEEKANKAKKSIVEAIIGFIIIKLARLIVEATYGTIHCTQVMNGLIVLSGGACLENANITWFADIIVRVINWVNSLVGILVVIMIIYAWFQIFISAWEEEKLKKAKMSLVYIAIGMFILVANYLILTFFILPETII